MVIKAVGCLLELHLTMKILWTYTYNNHALHSTIPRSLTPCRARLQQGRNKKEGERDEIKKAAVTCRNSITT